MKKLTILTGSGISQESGIPTFRDAKEGTWMNFNIEDVATPAGWKKNRQLVLDFYNQRKKDAEKVKPNAAHYGLVELEKHFDVSIITQNVDTLHERAGSKKVLHLHGQLDKKRSSFRPDEIVDWPDGEEIKIGDKCKYDSQYRPHVVWFGEDVPMLWTAEALTYDADIFVIIGTSLQVYPAASLINRVRTYDGVPIFILDKEIPEIDSPYFKIHSIEKSATQGIADLTARLLELT